MQWDNFGSNVNNAFYFVIDKIIDLQNFFTGQAKSIGFVVLFIAILTAALNHALTGTGLKENAIKIGKATLFFLIVIAAYPRVIGFITSWTFQMAEQSVYPSVKKYFETVTETVTDQYKFTVSSPQTPGYGSVRDGISWVSFNKTITYEVIKDNKKLFSDLVEKHPNSQMPYTTIAPAAVVKVLLLIAGECISFADDKENKIIPDFSRILKGLVCAFFIMLTGVFALLEYVVCFLEFMLVASVGVILFPLSIWEGSKFLSEKFIGAIVGFFVKLLFCNIAIFLMLYGFISLYYILSGNGNKFTGNADQIIFIIFTCLLFFFICKSAPGIAQSLLTGTPTLSAAGAIGAVAGAVGAAGAVAGMAKGTISNIGGSAKSIVGGATKLNHTFAEAGAAANAAGAAGHNKMGAALKSLGHNASQSLARSLFGGYSQDRSLGQMKNDRKTAGAARGRQG